MWALLNSCRQQWGHGGNCNTSNVTVKWMLPSWLTARLGGHGRAYVNRSQPSQAGQQHGAHWPLQPGLWPPQPPTWRESSASPPFMRPDSPSYKNPSLLALCFKNPLSHDMWFLSERVAEWEASKCASPPGRDTTRSGSRLPERGSPGGAWGPRQAFA